MDVDASRPLPYRLARERIRTGDLLLFSGESFVSRLIRWATGSRWSHVGLAWVAPGRARSSVLVLESTSYQDSRDVETGRITQGVSLTLLSERLRRYDGAIGWRELREPLTDAEIGRLEELRHELAGRPYEERRLDLIAAWWKCGGAEDLSSIFCSELVAEAYQSAGRLNDATPSDSYTPEDLYRRDDLFLPLVELAR